jgi:hypothetical protein
VPGIAGLGLWFFVVRKQEAAAEQAMAALPEQEAFFQTRLDSLTGHLLEEGRDTAEVAEEIHLWARDLNEPQQVKLVRFLAECGVTVSWKGPVPLFAAGRNPGNPWSAWNIRALALGMFALATFCLLWSGLLVFAFLATDLKHLMEIYLGAQITISFMLGVVGCSVPGLAALFGGLGLRWLLRREARRQSRSQAFQDKAQEIALERCLGRIRHILQGSEGALPAKEPTASRLARANAVSALADLGGARKGHLVTQLHANNFLSSFGLDGADLRGAQLAEARLSGISLPSVDLSGACLAGADLTRADLHGSRLWGADLRRADAAEVNLYKADLKGARLHQCNLRKADLRGANLVETNLWQTDLTDADLAGARVAAEQLAAAKSAGREDLQP